MFFPEFIEKDVLRTSSRFPRRTFLSLVFEESRAAAGCFSNGVFYRFRFLTAQVGWQKLRDGGVIGGLAKPSLVPITPDLMKGT